MKTLYLDIDGTVLVDDRHSVKSELDGGRLETAIRDAGFSHLICVGNFAAIAHSVTESVPDYDAIGVLRICAPEPLGDGRDVLEWLHRATL